VDLVGLVAVVLLFGGGTLVVISFSPIGRALAARLLGRSSAVLDEEELQKEIERLRGEVAGVAGMGDEMDAIRDQLNELGERVDFAERMLAKQREQALPKPGG
jgi:hypothetical protein